jgi:DNA-directed RNA polymerase delta subunit
MTYFKMEEIKASLYFENLMKSMIRQLNYKKESERELFENSIYTEMNNSSRFIECSSGQKKIQKTESRHFIKRNFSEEDIIETGGIYQNKSLFWGKDSGKEFEQSNHQSEIKLIEVNQHSRLHSSRLESNSDFYKFVVEKTGSNYRLHEEKIKYQKLLERFA